jgi:hypothetical protein
MGSVDADFDTGMPDGDYCDVVSECLQTITITGGRGHFKALVRSVTSLIPPALSSRTVKRLRQWRYASAVER